MPTRPDHKKLHPISLRISDVQYRSLAAMRQNTGLPAQELIRRAIDEFLDRDYAKRVNGLARARARA